MKIFQIIHVELRRSLGYWGFWVMLVLMSLISIAIYNMGVKFKVNGMSFIEQSFPDIWHIGTYIFSFLSYFPLLLLINSVSNDFNYRVIRQNIIDGWTPLHWLIGKIFFIIFLGIVTVLIAMATMSFEGFQNTPWVTFEIYTEKIYFLGLLFIRIVGLCSLGLMISSIIPRSNIALVIFMGMLLLEKYVLYKFENIPVLLPFQVFGELIPRPNVNKLIDAVLPITPYNTSDLMGISLIYILAFYGISLVVLYNKDIR